MFYLELVLLLRQLELVSAEGRDARLYAAGAERDQGQADQRKLATTFGKKKFTRGQCRDFVNIFGKRIGKNFANFDPNYMF
jgi:hypothetical protein